MDSAINSDELDVVYVGRGQYYQYAKDRVQEAVDKIQKNEMSYGEASRFYGVPKTTLYNKMKNSHNSPRGATTTLTKDQEDELAEWVLKHQEYGDPRTKHDIMNTAREIAELDDNSSNHFKNGLPTTGWVEGFLKRYPHIVFRKPETISKAAAVNTKEDFSKLWRNIYDFLEKTDQLDLLHKPEHWWNADETSFPLDPVPRKVLARKGSKNVHRREQGPPKANTTFTYAFSASGDYIEPLITLKDSATNIADIAFACGSVGANFAINQTDSGWAKEDSFYHYVTTHLYKQWELKGSPKPRILIIDGYRAHLSVRLLRWGKLYDCIIIVLYPNGTPYLQMCDTTMFKPMKEKHTELYQQWRLKNPFGNSNDVVLVKLVKMVNDAVIRKESIINGWRATGLQPFNFNNLKCDDLLSKSPDFIYDFKGHHTESSTTAAGRDEGTLFKLKTCRINCSIQLIDRTLIMDLERTEDYERFQRISFAFPAQLEQSAAQLCTNLSTVNQSVTDHVDPENSSTIFSAYTGECSTIHEVPIINSNDLLSTNVAFNDIEYIGENDDVDCASPHQTLHIEHQNESRLSNVAVTFSELSGRDRIFRSNVDTDFDMFDFGISDQIPTSQSLQNQSKLTKLTQKIRRDIRELGLLCAATDKKKLINILVINQQLNAIDPPETCSEMPLEPLSETRTIKTILVPPTMPQRVKAKTHRNVKVGYGVATAEEVLDHIAEREILDGQLEIEQEENEIEKRAREQKIEDVENQLQETRQALTTLRAENASNVKEAAQQKKSKKRGSNSNLDETILQNKTKIETKNSELKVLREQLKSLKADHITANKAAATKRRNDLQQKKERGNVVIPQPASAN
ncbi:uncharacterized protein LOC119079698 [Bradysia coprophila]|uniref:uncharacterized protein LOC119079698 n=1 Tax=Bradysia coprophila TaxID=38358 RepID=UPI00187D8DFB|nr:uncharacterized protein LOC119079698 [Bradysia coprophila]